MMKIKKTNESVSRTYDMDGIATERIDNAQYEILDASGNNVGSANIGQGYGNMSLNLQGHDSIAQGEANLKALLGIKD